MRNELGVRWFRLVLAFFAALDSNRRRWTLAAAAHRPNDFFTTGAMVLAANPVGLALPGDIATAATSNCKMVQLADLPVRVVGHRLIVDGAINGQKIGVMLDTGSVFTLISRPAATKLGLSRYKSRYRLFGVGGETDVEGALVDEFRIGQAKATGRRMFVAGEHELGDDVAVLLGEDFFHKIDVEFDLPHNTVRLFQPMDCGNKSLAYWATNADVVEIEEVDEASPKIVFTVQIGGQPVRAELDSGAGASVLDKPEAERLGVNGITPLGTRGGLGEKSIDVGVVPLPSLVIGNEAIKDTKIEVADISKGMRFAPTGGLVTAKVEGTASMLLGADFLRSHRVLVAHSQRRLYFTYVGGPVFQPGEPARAPTALNPEGARTRDLDRAIAEFEEAIRIDPQNAKAFLGRGMVWYQKKEYDRAMADYDAAITINPQYASAFDNRGRVWLDRGAFDRAIDDFDSAIRIDPQNAWAFGNRGVARIKKGQLELGIGDLTRAIELDPKFARAYVTRGDAKRRTGDPVGAIADYSHAIETDPKLALAYNQLAWVLATSERSAVRDGPRAIELALKACELSQWKNPTSIDTLAAAYARAGNFGDAIRWQRKAMENSGLSSDRDAAARLRLYEEGKAWPPD